MGRLAGKTAARTIDATGLTVAPGFIDIHNHSDYTIVAGRQRAEHDPPGRHLDDLRRRRIGRAQQALEGFQRLLRAAAEAGDFHQYRHLRGVERDLDDRCTANAPGRPRPKNSNRMRALVKEAMEQGALGVASSLSGPPGSWIDTDTLVAMCEVASRYGGIYSTHMRTEGRGVFESVAEAIEIGRRANVPVDIIHLKIAEHEMWGQMPELTATIAAGAGARAGCAGERLSVSRRAEQSVQHHSAVGARGRLAGDDRAAAGPGAAAAAGERNQPRHRRH